MSEAALQAHPPHEIGGFVNGFGNCKKVLYFSPMKYLPVFIAFVLPVIISCSSRPEIPPPVPTVQDNIALYIKKYANDPASYEPIETKTLDTVYFFELAKKRIDELSAEKDRFFESIKNEDKNVATYKKFGIYDADSRKRYVDMKRIYNEAIEKANVKEMTLKQKSDSISTSANPNPVCAIIYAHRCRIKNGFGALNLVDYYFLTNADGRMLFFSPNKAELPEYPNIYGADKPIDIE